MSLADTPLDLAAETDAAVVKCAVKLLFTPAIRNISFNHLEY